MTKSLRTRSWSLLLPWLTAIAAAIALSVAPAIAQMPDLSQMSGRPLPSGDLPGGTVSVRVVRGAITNNVAGVDVHLQGGPQPLAARTDANGRATFASVAAGAHLQATATVDGERLSSQSFTMPSAGGIRMLLVAGLKGSGDAVGAASGAPRAAPGDVTFGTQSRFIIELAEGSLEVYGLFDLTNLAATPVMPAKPIVFELPAEARNTTVLDGSTADAKADGTRVLVNGPFAPGATSVQIAYRLSYDGDTARLSQALPLRLPQTTVIVRKFEGAQIQLANVTGQREVPAEGRTYVVTNGGALDAGTPISLTIRGLPHHPTWPRYSALALAAIVIVGGIALALRTGPIAADKSAARALRARRGTLFEQLVSLERRRAGARQDDAGLLARRDALMAEIEAIDEALAALMPDAAPTAAAAAAARSASPRASGTAGPAGEAATAIAAGSAGSGSATATAAASVSSHQAEIPAAADRRSEQLGVGPAGR